MRLTSRLMTVAIVTVVVVGLASAPASAATIQTGHIDVLDVDYANGVLTLDIKEYNPANDDTSPAGTVLQALPASAVTVPAGAAWACLGAAGSTAYVLPQTQNPNLLWPGWNTQDVPAAQGPVQMQLVGWTTPPGGRFALYTLAGLPATPTYRLNTNGALGCTVTTWPGNIAAAAHAHGNWAFSTLGTYTLTFRATAQGGAGATSGNVVYTFQIG